MFVKIISRRRASTTRVIFAVAAICAVVACGGDNISNVAPGFLGGTSDNHEIGLVVNSTGKSLTMFQVGSPKIVVQIPFGTSSTITPTGLSTRLRLAAVPLGNAASVALVDLVAQTVKRNYTFSSGNSTGSVFSDDTTIFAANSTTNVVGRMFVGQASDAITTTAPVAPAPTAIQFASGRVLVVSGNLDNTFTPIGNGIVKAIDPVTMAVVGTATMGGTNSSDAAIGPDGMLYVLNTGNYSDPGNMTIVNPATMAVVQTVEGMGVGPGAISIDANGYAYISGFFSGTIVWNTVTKAFVRAPAAPVCAPATGGCRGAFAAATSANGNLYQAFFGSTSPSLPPYVFVYKAGTFALTDSIAVGVGPSSITIKTF